MVKLLHLAYFLPVFGFLPLYPCHMVHSLGAELLRRVHQVYCLDNLDLCIWRWAGVVPGTQALRKPVSEADIELYDHLLVDSRSNICLCWESGIIWLDQSKYI